MEILDIVANIIMAIGVGFMLFGLIGLFRFDNFYARILIAGKIDTVGALTIVFGLMVKHGFGFFSLKLLLLAVFILLLNPLVSHIVARSAYLSGHSNEDDHVGHVGRKI